MGVKALGLVSGGLDSSLAAKVMLGLGVDVEIVNFSTGFSIIEHTRHIKDPKEVVDRTERTQRLADELKVKLHTVDISKNYLPVITRPKYGYGGNVNPCVDCRIYVFKQAKVLMEKLNARFIFSGEVLGQRPMSQHRDAMKNVETESGMTGLVLRPLSARLLDPTIPEVKGWVDRSKLFAFTGRSRKPQMELAKQLGLDDCPQPAGGCCYLTDSNYATKLRDIFDHNGKESLTFEDTALLKVGRHFRVSENIKVIVGRNERENNFLMGHEKGKHVFRIHDFPSAHVLAEIKNALGPEDLMLLASIAARYSDGKDRARVVVEHQHENHTQLVEAAPIEESRLEAWRI